MKFYKTIQNHGVNGGSNVLVWERDIAQLLLALTGGGGRHTAIHLYEPKFSLFHAVLWGICQI